jgi:hypothetical protein
MSNNEGPLPKRFLRVAFVGSLPFAVSLVIGAWSLGIFLGSLVNQSR